MFLTMFALNLRFLDLNAVVVLELVQDDVDVLQDVEVHIVVDFQDGSFVVKLWQDEPQRLMKTNGKLL